MFTTSLRRFRDDESGAITAFVLMMFLAMIVVAGMAVDFMRHESARADLQNALDRGVLAAAAGSQRLGGMVSVDMTDAEKAEVRAANQELILSYMQSRSFRSAQPVLNVTLPEDLQIGETAVTATASYSFGTFFIKLIGLDTMTVPTAASARQGTLDLEIALVVDVSGSMGGSDPASAGISKLQALKDAAGSFVTQLMPDEDLNSDGSVDQILFSIIPYSAHTSATPALAQYFDLKPIPGFSEKHSYGYCFDLDYSDPEDGPNKDFGVAAMARADGSDFTQYQHVRYEVGYSSENNVGTIAVCPRQVNWITPYSNKRQDLLDAISALTTENWTATYQGVKWASALMDPTMQGFVENLVDAGTIDTQYKGWPRAYSDRSVRKIMIVMTDGVNTRLHKMNNSYYKTRSNNTSFLALSDQQKYDYWDVNGYPNNKFNLVITNANGDRTGDRLTLAACDAAIVGNPNVTIYTIGYDLDPASSDDTETIQMLRDCASSGGAYIADENFSIEAAFDSIAARIQLLSLTQ